ncbi:MAG: cyanoexosortase B system-associated protein [Leptolyngbyaceae cyanobacterium]
MSQATKPMPKQWSIIQGGLVVMLAAVIAIAMLPSYFSGQWPWSADLPLPHLSQMRDLIETPLELSGWESTYHQEVTIGRKSWTVTEYRRLESGADQPETFALLLRPQLAVDQQPEVEWVDLRGAQGWQVSDRHTVQFEAITDGASAPLEVKTRYQRGIDERNTLAVMQWYAWPQGGHFAPGRWFWADQAQQWQQREHMPWVGVSVLLQIEPVGNIRPHTDTVVEIAKAVQQSLLASTFRS